MITQNILFFLPVILCSCQSDLPDIGELNSTEFKTHEDLHTLPLVLVETIYTMV